MAMDTIRHVVSTLGTADIGERLEMQLVYGMIYAFQEQSDDERVLLSLLNTSPRPRD